MSTAPLFTSHKNVEYATADDIQTHFVAAMKDLYCLAFLLTADADRAEDCVIRFIRECLRSRYILKEKLPAWVRDTVVWNGIRIVKDIEGLPFGDSRVARFLSCPSHRNLSLAQPITRPAFWN